MKSIFLYLLLFLSFIANCQSNIDVLHYKFRIELNDKNDTILGNAIITAVAIDNIHPITFDLSGIDVNGKGMVVTYAITNWKTQKPITWKQENSKLIINVAHSKGDTILFTISYKGIPADGLIISKNKYGDRTFFADNWPNRAHNWIPCIDDPADKASFEFLVTAPSQYKVISNGEKISEEADPEKGFTTTHWKEDVPLSTKVMVIGVSKFAVKKYEDSPPNIPVTVWVYPQDSLQGFKNYSFAPAILKFYSDYIGPYPYNKLANVQSKTIFGGMENASAIFYFEESAEIKKSVEDLLAHEIAHQWFGDMASEKSFAHLWLSEGFATYFTDLYIGSKYGSDSMNRRLMQERTQAAEFAKKSALSVVDSVSDLMALLNPNSYQKGGWVLHMLHRRMGDSVFHLFIKTYYDRYKGKNASTEDLEAVAEEVYHTDLKTFFRQWLYTPGIPQLQLQWKYNKKNKKVSITVLQVQKRAVFQFPLQIGMHTASGKTVTLDLNITKQAETFTFPVKENITGLVADPNVSLLFEGNIENGNR